ncbi:transketolase-like TK C-terminal-containing protein [Kitasatospora sp. NPDC101801]|uniref:transketolase-like TK C-terminal-containing protein n=1 Tax=Kitasatospora sp. NPDC101801 TaxID=3364103 RepID=UPI00380EA79B
METRGPSRGGYVLMEAGSGVPAVVLLATGGELAVALRAREILEGDAIATRVVVMVCAERFERQPAAYREAVLPRGVVVRVSVEAGAVLGWHALAGEAGVAVRLDRSGLSAPYRTLYEQLGFTPERIAAQARRSLAKARERAA